MSDLNKHWVLSWTSFTSSGGDCSDRGWPWKESEFPVAGGIGHWLEKRDLQMQVSSVLALSERIVEHMDLIWGGLK